MGDADARPGDEDLDDPLPQQSPKKKARPDGKTLAALHARAVERGRWL